MVRPLFKPGAGSAHHEFGVWLKDSRLHRRPWPFDRCAIVSFRLAGAFAVIVLFKQATQLVIAEIERFRRAALMPAMSSQGGVDELRFIKGDGGIEGDGQGCCVRFHHRCGRRFVGRLARRARPPG